METIESSPIEYSTGEHVLPLNIQRENFAIVYQHVEMAESSPVEYSTGELLRAFTRV